MRETARLIQRFRGGDMNAIDPQRVSSGHIGKPAEFFLRLEKDDTFAPIVCAHLIV